MPSSRTHPCVSPAPPKSPSKKAQYLYRTHTIALDPTAEQLRLLTRHADYARAAYNSSLRCYKDGKKAVHEPIIDALQSEWHDIRASKYPWGSKLSQSVAEYAIKALGHGIRAAKDRHLANAAPRFHSRSRKAAFRIGDRTERARTQGQEIKLPGIGSVRMRESLRLPGGLHKVTIKREGGHWFACLTVKFRKPQRSDHRPGTVPIGFDVGIRKMLACSDGTVYEHYPSRKTARRVKHQEGKIRRYKKQLARQALGSARRERTVLKLHKARYRIKCARDDAQHKAATEVVGRAGAVGVEALDARAMTQGTEQRSPGQISGAAMSAMLYKLAYRCEAAGIRLARADRYFASSQLCSVCGRRQKMPMGKKEYRCPCGSVLDRDVNAAVNLKPPAAAVA